MPRMSFVAWVCLIVILVATVVLVDAVSISGERSLRTSRFRLQRRSRSVIHTDTDTDTDSEAEAEVEAGDPFPLKEAPSGFPVPTALAAQGSDHESDCESAKASTPTHPATWWKGPRAKGAHIEQSLDQVKAITWSAAKSLAPSPAGIRTYCDYRIKYVDEGLSYVIKSHELNDGTHSQHYIRALPTGSADLESDLDVTVSGKGSYLVAKLWNQDFEEAWGKPSGIVFDTNIYATGWASEIIAPITVGKMTYKPPDPHCYTKDDTHYTFSVKTGQSNFAYAKYLAFYDHDMTKLKIDTAVGWLNSLVEKIFKYGKGDIDGIAAAFAKAKDIKALDLAKKISAAVEGGKLALTASIKSGGELLLKMYKEGGYLDKDGDFLHDGVGMDSDTMKLRNRNYEKHCQTVDGLLYTPPKKGQLPPDCDVVMKAISSSMLYGIETYWCQGTFMDVVANQQGGGRHLLTFAQYYDSFTENMGDFNKMIEHEITWGKLDRTSKEAWPTIIVRGSKYMYRCLFALEHMIALWESYVLAQGVSLSDAKKKMTDFLTNIFVFQQLSTLVKDYQLLYKSYRKSKLEVADRTRDAAVSEISTAWSRAYTEVHLSGTYSFSQNSLIDVTRAWGLQAASFCEIVLHVMGRDKDTFVK